MIDYILGFSLMIVGWLIGIWTGFKLSKELRNKKDVTKNE